MSKREDLVPFGQRRSEKWTRISDYVRGAEAQFMLVDQGDPHPPLRQGRVSRRGLWLPIYLLLIAAAALWATGALERPGSAGDQVAEAPGKAEGTSSQGVRFGLCDQGGSTNCVVDGGSFYMGGENIQIAGLAAPATHAARCDAEALLGAAATRRLQATLNSGLVTTKSASPERDANGRLLKSVAVDGRDVGQMLLAAGLAHSLEGPTRAGWC